MVEHFNRNHITTSLRYFDYPKYPLDVAGSSDCHASFQCNSPPSTQRYSLFDDGIGRHRRITLRGAQPERGMVGIVISVDQIMQHARVLEVGRIRFLEHRRGAHVERDFAAVVGPAP